VERDKGLTVVDAERSEVARVNTQTGEVIEARDFGGYAGVATVALSREQADTLAEMLPDEAHDILPTGEVYVSQVHYRRLLNKVFGPGGWALVPRGPFASQKGAKTETITREYALVGPGGRFISEAIGEAEYQPTNDRMSYASACEACKSNALTRCCKDLGIASECWDKRFCEKWIAGHAIQVWRKGGGKPQWRRKDATPFYDETGEAKPREGQTERPATVSREAGEDRDESEPEVYARAGVEPPARKFDPQPAHRQPGVVKVPCPHCGCSAGPSKFPKAGQTYYCYDCKHPFDPGAEQ
jgi:ribonuclease HI